MQNFFRYSSSLFVFLIIASVGLLSGCSRAPQAYFQPGTSLPYEHSVRTSAPAPVAEPTAELTASRSDAPALSTKPAWEVADVTAEPAIRVEVRRPTVWQRYKQMLPRKATPPGCDQIVLRNGDVIDAKVKEVGVNEIRYKKCDRQDGPDYTVLKRDILSIKYSNGEVERFGNANTTPTYNNNSSSSGGRSYDSPTNARNDGPRTDPFAIVSIATGAVAFLLGGGGLLLVASAIVFGALSLTRIRRNPERSKGKGLAIGGMVAGLVAAAYIIYVIAALGGF